MREQLRVGFAGCGGIVQQVHLRLLQVRKDVKLFAVAEPDGAAVAAVLRRFPGVRPYARLSEMLAAVDLDAVVIALPTALHAAAACEVFSAGLHAYIEKPLATTVEEAEAVAQAWRRSGCVGVVGFNCRANPLLVRLRDLMRSGRAGSLVYMRSVFATAPRELSPWRQQRRTGGGALLDLGVHHIDLIRFLTGAEIAGVRATITSRKSEQDTALLELQLENGVGVHAFFSLAAAETDHVEVHGEAARLSVARFTSLDVHVVDNPGRGAVHLAGRCAALPHSASCHACSRRAAHHCANPVMGFCSTTSFARPGPASHLSMRPTLPTGLLALRLSRRQSRRCRPVAWKSRPC
jgi:predicted dehydrogenase